MARPLASGTRAVRHAGAILIAALARGAAQALECDPGICVGDPCTIEGTHRLALDCFLDFGTKDVTLGPSGRLIATQPGNSTLISARRLTVRGTITVVGDLGLSADEDLTTAQAPGAGIIRVRRDATEFTSELGIDAGGDVILGGRRVSVAGGDGVASISGSNVTIGSRLIADGFGEFGGMLIEATAGSITTTGQVSARGRAPNTYGEINLYAAGGGITIGAPLEVTRDGYLSFSAETDVTVDGDVRVEGTTNGPTFVVSAGGDITLRGRVRARGRGDANGGLVQLFSSTGSITFDGDVDVSYGGTSSFTQAGAVFVDDACSVTLHGALIARGAPGGLHSIRYREQMDVTGGAMLTSGGTNEIFCRCVNPPSCSGGCVSDPIGLAGADVEPPAVVTPTQMAACSPSGAFLD